MWTFERVQELFDEYVLRDVIFEVNNLMCGRGANGADANAAGIDQKIWEKLLEKGGVSPEGRAKLFRKERISQRDTIGPFDPFTITTLGRLAGGEKPLLSADEANHVIERVLRYQGRVRSDGSLVPAEDRSHSGRELA